MTENGSALWRPSQTPYWSRSGWYDSFICDAAVVSLRSLSVQREDGRTHRDQSGVQHRRTQVRRVEQVPEVLDEMGARKHPGAQRTKMTRMRL